MWWVEVSAASLLTEVLLYHFVHPHAPVKLAAQSERSCFAGPLSVQKCLRVFMQLNMISWIMVLLSGFLWCVLFCYKCITVPLYCHCTWVSVFCWLRLSDVLGVTMCAKVWLCIAVCMHCGWWVAACGWGCFWGCLVGPWGLSACRAHLPQLTVWSRADGRLIGWGYACMRACVCSCLALGLW